MNKNSIILELWESRELKEAIDKMQPEDLREDLRSELFKVLCEMDEERLIDMRTPFDERVQQRKLENCGRLVRRILFVVQRIS